MKNLFSSILIMLCICSCGFEPVYQQRDGQINSYDLLQQINVYAPAGRSGDQLKAAIEDRFYQSERPSLARYKLELTLDISARPFIIDPDGISSRYEVTVLSSYKLLRASDDKKLHEGNIQRQVSYNVSQDDDYATYIAARDARKQGIDALANDLALRLAALLAQTGE